MAADRKYSSEVVFEYFCYGISYMLMFFLEYRNMGFLRKKVNKFLQERLCSCIDSSVDIQVVSMVLVTILV